ncbi:MAG: hypothetical protein GVY36_05165 [Verrucomicrobia bacterium]|jgi:hypothetical protein|nr:hypothetical protein [Verrucomicrobiota bacterium]
MAWRIADYIERGEIDNRIKDRVTGQIWLFGQKEPVKLELTGNPYRDLAGQYLRFLNPNPKALPEHLHGFAKEQTGVVGDITAARRVKILDIPDDEFEHYYINKIKMPYHWGNCLYLEWHSVRNGRVVIEATDYVLEVEPEATWQMSEAEEVKQQEANGRAMSNFMDQLVQAANEAAVTEGEDEAPQSEAEAAADAEAARMDLLMDRVTARLEREKDLEPDAFERILNEERERMRRERGEPEPEPLTPEEEAEREKWIEEINAAAESALNEPSDHEEDRDHPLVEFTQEFGIRIDQATEENRWLEENASEEHPLNALKYGIWFASAKLAGALNHRKDEWPPDELNAGDTLVRLKKARSYLRDAERGLESAEGEKLADPSWFPPIRQELKSISRSVDQFIDEVRFILRDPDDIR